MKHTQSLVQRLMPALTRSLNPSVSATQIEYLTEPCIQVNENDEPIGQISKEDCHRAESITLHRAFSVFLFNPEKKLLLQKRANSKITFPHCWTNSCCSHPLFNNAEMEQTRGFIGVRRAAKRKLEHELGIKELDLERLNVMGRFIYKAPSDDLWGEHELDYALVVPNFTSKLDLNLDEVEDICFVDQKELDIMMHKEKHIFSPWFTLLYKHKWLHQWWDNLDALSAYQDLEKIHHLN